MRGISRNWQYVVVLVLLSIAIVLQVWSAISTQHIVSAARKDAISLNSKEIVALEKDRQELIGKQIENRIKGEFETILATGFRGLAAVLVTVGGAILAWRTYADTRTKERQDRLGTELSNTVARLVANEERQRVVGAAGLLPFFVADRADFHLQALAALIAAARFDNELP